MLSHDVLAPASVPSVYTHEPKAVTVELCNNYRMSSSNSAEVPRHNHHLVKIWEFSHYQHSHHMRCKGCEIIVS